MPESITTLTEISVLTLVPPLSVHALQKGSGGLAQRAPIVYSSFHAAKRYPTY